MSECQDEVKRSAEIVHVAQPQQHYDRRSIFITAGCISGVPSSAPVVSQNVKLSHSRRRKGQKKALQLRGNDAGR